MESRQMILFTLVVAFTLSACGQSTIPFLGKWVQVKEGKMGQMKTAEDPILLKVTPTVFDFSYQEESLFAQEDDYVYDDEKQEIEFTEKFRCWYESESDNELVVTNKIRICNHFFRREDNFKIRQPSADVLILEKKSEGYQYYFVKKKVYQQMQTDASLAKMHEVTEEETLKKTEVESARKEAQMLGRRMRSASFRNPEGSSKAIHEHFLEHLQYPAFHQGTFSIQVKGVVEASGILSQVTFETKKMGILADDSTKINAYLQEVQRCIDLMEPWLPLLDRDAKPKAAQVKFTVRFNDIGVKYKNGLFAVKNHFEDHLRYPNWHEKWQEPSFEVMMKGLVTSEGDLTEISVVENGAEQHFTDLKKRTYYAEEAVRAAGEMEKWTPKRGEEGRRTMAGWIHFYAKF